MSNCRFIRRAQALIAAVVVIAMIGAGTAGAAPKGAQKAPIYGPNILSSGASCSTGAAPTATRFGFVVLNTPGKDGRLTGEVSIKGASPNTAYSLADQQDPGNCENIIQFAMVTTNGQGNANVHFSVARIPSATNFWVGLEAGGFSQVLGSSAVPLA